MAEVWERWGAVVTATVVAVPLAMVAVWALARWRLRASAVVGVAADAGGRAGGLTANAGRRDGPVDGSRAATRWAWRRSAAEVGAVAGTLPWLWMVMTPRPADSTVNPVPLSDLAALATATPATIVVQLVGNLLVFAALGFCLPIRWRIGAGAVAVVAASGAVAIEALQFGLDLGRVSTVDDVLVNTLGAVLAAWLSRPWWARRGDPVAGGNGVTAEQPPARGGRASTTEAASRSNRRPR